MYNDKINTFIKKIDDINMVNLNDYNYCLQFINNDAEILLFIIEKCGQYDYYYKNNLNDLLINFVSYIKLEKIKKIL